MLAGREHLHRHPRMVDRAGGDHDRVDVVRGEQLRRTSHARRRARRQPPLRCSARVAATATSSAPAVLACVAGVDDAHSAEPGDADPHLGSIRLDSAEASMAASQSLAQPIEQRAATAGRGATLADVAEYAGVSASTASRALTVAASFPPRHAPQSRRPRRRSSSSRRCSRGRCARARHTPSASSSRTSRARSTPPP